MNGYGYGNHRGGSERRPYGPRGGGRRSSGFGGGGGYGSRSSSGHRRPPRHIDCPPDLREPFTDARDFLAGLIRVFGLPARLSFGGVQPARDGRQIIIDIRAVQAPSDRGRGDEDERDDELGLLIGKHGATLEALSAVTNAVMHKGDFRDLFFAVDIEGYRARRTATLRNLAQRCGDRVLREGVSIELDPMPPSERRIVHMALAGHRELATESTGQGISRRVVIMPRSDHRRPAPPRDDDEEEYVD